MTKNKDGQIVQKLVKVDRPSESIRVHKRVGLDSHMFSLANTDLSNPLGSSGEV